jgi:hypothetical protein
LRGASAALLGGLDAKAKLVTQALRVFAAHWLAQPKLAKPAKAGWGGRIRTCEWRHQKPLPYHLATPQHAQ